MAGSHIGLQKTKSGGIITVFSSLAISQGGQTRRHAALWGAKRRDFVLLKSFAMLTLALL